MNVVSFRYALRRGTAAEWTAANPVLLLGEPGVEIDSLLWKVGDGLTAWAALPYFNASGGGVTVHGNLSGRDAADQHPVSAITGFLEAVQDIVGAMVVQAGGTYNDALGTITFPSGGGVDDSEGLMLDGSFMMFDNNYLVLA